MPFTPQLNVVSAGDTVKLGVFAAEFIHVNHSIADACALAINTPCGYIIHTGDFKIDVSPIEGEMIDLARFGELGKKGVTLMLCESTNAERGGFTPSEKSVGGTLEDIFTANEGKRIIISTFSSNVHRVQQIIDASIKFGRKVAITGRSMINIVSAAVELGYMKVPKDTLVDINDIKRMLPHRAPFLLVDRVYHMDETSVAGIKQVTFNEPFFQGHFPNEPIMPGVLIVEAMAQCSGIYVMSKVDNPEEYSTYFLRIDNVRFRQKVVPGDTMQIECEIVSPSSRKISQVECKVFVGDTLACEATLLLQIVKNK